MRDYDNYIFFAITSVVLFAARWIYYKFKKVDETEQIRAKLDNHVENYNEFKDDTKTRLNKIEDRAYEQKK